MTVDNFDELDDAIRRLEAAAAVITRAQMEPGWELDRTDLGLTLHAAPRLRRPAAHRDPRRVMRRTIDTRKPTWPPRPVGHPCAPRLLRVLDRRDTPAITTSDTDERSR